MKPRLVIFDFDGTLADSFGWFLDVGDALADRHRFDRLDRSDLDRLRTLDARQMLKQHRVPLWKLPLIARDARKLMARDVERMPLFDGVRPALARLAAGGTRLAIVTSNSRANVLRVLGPDTAARISAFECGVSLFGKPRRLRRVLRTTDIPAAEALYVGDELRDAVAARAAGIPFGAVSWGYAHPDTLRARSPARIFERVEDLASCLAE
jgi:phosphoglycolate phosphatase